MDGRRFAALAFAIAIAFPLAIAGQGKFIVKLATPAPENTPWTDALRSMGSAWQKGTDGRVTFQLAPNIGEKAALDRIAIGNFQAATLTAGGLSDLDEAFNVFGIPFFFESDEELSYVQEQVTPLFVRRLEAKKFHLLGWGNAGWVQVFSKQPIRSLADLKKLKLYVGEGSPKLERWYTTNGFHVVPLNMAQIPTQLKVPGGIEAASSVPVLANAVQIFRDAPYMLDIRVAPVTSATILSEAAWTRIAADDRPKLVQAAKDTEQRMNAQAPGLDAKAVESMKTAGLKVITLDAAALGAFHTAADGLMKTQRGDMVPADVFDAVVKARDAFRASKRAK